jgi:hypothetical protein
MITRILTVSSTGLRSVRSQYDVAAVLTIDGETIAPRHAQDSATVLIGLDPSGRFAAGEVDWVHLVGAVDEVGGVTSLTKVTDGRYACAGLVTIKGQAMRLSDVVEIPSTVAKLFNPPIGPGRYKCVDLSASSAEIQNINPAQYTLTHSSEIGGAVYYRTDPTIAGALEGLNSVPLQADSAATQTRPGYDIGTPFAFIDGSMTTTANGAGASFHGVYFDFKVAATVPGSPLSPAPQANDTPIVAYAIETTISCNRQTYDTTTQYADFALGVFAGKNRTGVAQNLQNSNFVWRKSNLAPHKAVKWVSSAEGIQTFYYRPTTSFSAASLHLNDASGSRSLWNDFKLICAGMNSQIKLTNGTIPEVGSIVNISADVAKTFIPNITPGAYPVLKNDNVGPWRLGAPLTLISPNGAALTWALYIGDTAYDEGSTVTIALEVGTLYQLRVNSPEIISQVEYTIAYPGSLNEVTTSSTGSNNFSINHRPTIEQQVNAAGRNGSITVVTGPWTKTYPIKLQYTQKGSIGMESEAAFKTGNTFAIGFTTDGLRTFSEARIEVFTLAGVSAVAMFTATGTGRTFNLTMPAVDNYRLAVSVLYADTTRPNETFSINFSTTA